MKNLFFFLSTICLYILFSPGIIFQPYKFKTIGYLFLGVLFTVFYHMMYDFFYNIKENMTTSENINENEDYSFNLVKDEMGEKLKSILNNGKSDEEKETEFLEYFNQKTKNWSPSDIQLFKEKYKIKLGRNDDDKDEKLIMALESTNVDMIQKIDSLSESQQNALIKVFQSMDHESIQNLEYLNDEKLKQMLYEIS